MTLTTIIPTFNRPYFLKQCLKSVANQTIKPDEIFIIDNNKDSNINKKVFSECLKEINLNLKYFENYGNIQSFDDITCCNFHSSNNKRTTGYFSKGRVLLFCIKVSIIS